MQQFAGYEVAPGQEVAVTGADSTIFHLSIVALPHSANNAQATLYATVEGKTFAVASLNSKAKLNQVAVDLIFPKAQTPVFTVKGNSPVHLTGYSQEMEDDMMGEGDDFESASDEEEELPITKATKKEVAQKEVKKAAPAPVAAAAEEESEGDEEGSDEEGDLEDLTSEELKQLAEEMEEDDEEEEGEEEEESEEEEEMPPVSKGRRPESGKPTAKFAGKPAQNNAGRQGGKKAGRN